MNDNEVAAEIPVREEGPPPGDLVAAERNGGSGALLQLKPDDLRQQQYDVFQVGMDKVDGFSGIVTFDKSRGFDVKDLTEHRKFPIRSRINLLFDEVGGFGKYVKEHAQSGENESRVYVGWARSTLYTPRAGAVLDDDGTLPGWREHGCVFTPVPGDELVRWLSNDREWHSEDNFTALVDNVFDSFRNPDAQEVLDAITSLKVESNQSRGEQTTAQKKEAVASIRTELKSTVPGMFQIKCIAFEDFEVEFDVRLRTRVSNTLEVQFKPVIVNRHGLETRIMAEFTRRVKEATGLEPLVGYKEGR